MKFKMLPIMLAASTMAAASAVNAGDWEVGATVPYYDLDDAAGANSQSGFGIHYGYRSDDAVGFEVSATRVQTSLTSSDEEESISGSYDFTDLRLDGIWYLQNEGAVLPYAALGLSYITSSTSGSVNSVDEDGAFSAALGLKTHLNEKLRARFEIRMMDNLDNELDHNVVTLGLSYVIGD